MSGKVNSTTVYPPAGDAVRYDLGRNNVSKIHVQMSSWGTTNGVYVIFADGSQRVYINMPFSYDFVRDTQVKGRPA